MSIVRGPSCPRCGNECGFWGSGLKAPTLFCKTCGWNEEDGTTASERTREYLLKEREFLKKVEDIEAGGTAK